MSRWMSWIKTKEFKALMCLMSMFLAVGLINPNFLELKNIMLCINGSVVYIVVAIGIAFVILTGEIDVSIGATLGLSAAIAGSMIRDELPWSIAIVVALIFGATIGLINGIGVTFLKIPSIIMTLGCCGIVRGMIYVYTDGKWVENLPFEFKTLSQAALAGTLSYFLIGVLLFMLIIHLILTQTRKGKYFVAVGDNVCGATLLGIPVTTTKCLSFVLCGMFAAVGGILYASRVGFITPMAGNAYEMKAIAACIIGGISLKGGVGSVIGATVGAMIMASISRILVFVGISSDYDNTITGILLITIVVIDAWTQSRQAEKARRIRLSNRLAQDEGGMERHE